MFSACALNGSHRAGGVLDCSESISDYEYLINQSMASMSFFSLVRGTSNNFYFLIGRHACTVHVLVTVAVSRSRTWYEGLLSYSESIRVCVLFPMSS